MKRGVLSFLAMLALASCTSSNEISFQDAKARAQDILHQESHDSHLIAKRNEATIQTDEEEFRFSLADSYFARISRMNASATYVTQQDNGDYLCYTVDQNGNVSSDTNQETAQQTLNTLLKDYYAYLTLPSDALSALLNLSSTEESQIHNLSSQAKGNLSFQDQREQATISVAYQDYLPVCYESHSDTETVSVSYRFGNTNKTLPFSSNK